MLLHVAILTKEIMIVSQIVQIFTVRKVSRKLHRFVERLQYLYKEKQLFQVREQVSLFKTRIGSSFENYKFLKKT